MTYFSMDSKSLCDTCKDKCIMYPCDNIILQCDFYSEPKDTINLEN